MSDFDMVLVDDKMDLIITDLVVLNKKERAPPKYVVIDPGINEGGRLISGKRYLAYTREVPARLGRVAVTDIKIINPGDRVPIGYRPLTETMDDNVKSFSSKVILVKMDPLESVKDAVTEILILSGSKREHVPDGYRRLPELNGFSVCFHTQKINSKSPTNSPSVNNGASSAPKSTDHTQAGTQLPPSNASSHQSPKKPKSAIDGITFELGDSRGVDQYLKQFLLPDLQILSFDEIDSKFDIDWPMVEEQVKG